jgi:hypothetical protein
VGNEIENLETQIITKQIQDLRKKFGPTKLNKKKSFQNNNNLKTKK